MTNAWCDCVADRSDVIDTSLKSSFEVDQVFQEKIRRLHQVRSDNALKNTRVGDVGCRLNYGFYQ